MDCQQFLAEFSDFIDGRAEPEVSRKMEAHRSACDGCRQYFDAVGAGRELLRALPPLDLSSDFRSRLEHRIFHLEDGASIARQSLGSGATMVSVLAVAVLVSLSAWAPRMDHSPHTVELPVVVVGDPPADVFTPARATPTFSRNLSIFSTTEFQDGIWGDSHDLLREYSPILDRRREQAMVRFGIE